MPARHDHFPWSPHYGHFNFFENRLEEHSKVASLETDDSKGVYNIKLRDGRTLRIFICECYSFGLAEYDETVYELGKLDAVIINSEWCGYTPDVKKHCMQNRVGVFRIVEFMAALNRTNFWGYLTEEQKTIFKEKGWL